MSTQITTAMVEDYKDGIQILVQQMASKLRGAVDEEGINGERAAFDQVGVVELVEDTTRHAKTQHLDTPHARRWVDAVPARRADLRDLQDVVRILNDPMGSYARTFAMAANRRIDDVIIDAFFADAKTGRDGTNDTPFPATQQVTTAAGLDLDKVLDAKRILDDNDVPPDNRHICVSPFQLKELLEITNFTSADFNTVKALVRGEINEFLGFTWHTSTRLDVDGTSRRRVPVWHMEGMKLGVNSDVDLRVTEMPDFNYSWQVWISVDVGATRMQEEMVVEIKCTES